MDIGIYGWLSLVILWLLIGFCTAVVIRSYDSDHRPDMDNGYYMFIVVIWSLALLLSALTRILPSIDYCADKIKDKRKTNLAEKQEE